MSAPLLIRLLASGAVACALAASAQVGAAADESSPPNANRWRVIVHPSNPSRSLARSAVERIYRRRTTFWEDGRALIAINLPVGDPTRDTFMRDVMRTSAGELATFWNRQYFHGVAPPAVLQSAQAVCAYVAATPGAIGYVGSCPDGAQVAGMEIDLER